MVFTRSSALPSVQSPPPVPSSPVQVQTDVPIPIPASARKLRVARGDRPVQTGSTQHLQAFALQYSSYFVLEESLDLILTTHSAPVLPLLIVLDDQAQFLY